MSYIQERYKPQALGANSVTVVRSSGIGGFIVTTTGNIAIADNTVSATTLLATTPVTAGTYLPLVMWNSTNGAVVTLSGGASGTILLD